MNLNDPRLAFLLTAHCIFYATAQASSAQSSIDCNLLSKRVDGSLLPVEVELVRVADAYGVLTNKQEFSGLKQLAIQDFRASESEMLLKLISRCPSLEALALSSRSRDPESYISKGLLEKLVKEHHLNLSLFQVKLPDIALSSVEIPGKRAIVVSGDLNAQVSDLLSLSSFDSVWMASSCLTSNITPNEILSLSRMMSLKRLSISGSPAFPLLAIDLQKLESLEEIQSFGFANCSIIGSGMRNLTQLQSIHFENCSLAPEVLNEALAHGRIDSITLSACAIDGAMPRVSRASRQANGKSLCLMYPRILDLTALDAFDRSLSVTLGNPIGTFSGHGEEGCVGCYCLRARQHTTSLSPEYLTAAIKLKNLSELRLQSCSLKEVAAADVALLSPLEALALDAVHITSGPFLSTLLQKSIGKKTTELCVLCTECPEPADGPVKVDGSSLQRLALNDLSVVQISFEENSLSSVRHLKLENLEYPNGLAKFRDTGLGKQVVDLEIGFSDFNSGELDTILDAFPRVKSIRFYSCDFEFPDDLKALGKLGDLRSVSLVLCNTAIDDLQVRDTCQEVEHIKIAPLCRRWGR